MIPSVGAVLWLLVQPLLPAPAADAPPPVYAEFWAAPGAPSDVGRVKDAFAKAIADRKGPTISTDFTDEVATSPGALSEWRTRLSKAIEKYRAFKYLEATADLTDLAAAVESEGGGDLHARAIADVYLYRGLSRLEIGQANEAWDDIVRSIRIDGTRLIDPAAIPPRAAAMFRRATAEVATAPHALLEIRAPRDAHISVDGRDVAGPATVALGPHLVRIEAPGFETWASVVAVTAARQTIEPPLRGWLPPDNQRLLAGVSMAQIKKGRVVLGAVRRKADGWRFLARVVDLPGGQTVSEEAMLGESAAEHTVGTVLSHVLDPAIAPLHRDPTPQAEPPAWYKRWWVWAIVGGAATGFAIAVAASSSSSGGAHTLGTISGPPPPK